MTGIRPRGTLVENAAGSTQVEPQDSSGRESGDEDPSLLPCIGRVGRYELVGRIAVGGMAEIFLARESFGTASRRVVVKFVRSDADDEERFRAMFMRECQIAMRLAHPNICHVYELGADASPCYLAMELVEGQSLNDLILRDRTRGSVVPPAVYAAIFARVADALEYAHSAKDERGRPFTIVHRDVSPHNIMISYGGGVKLLDFGIAKVKQAGISPTSTEHGALKGKFGYMSPEQATGRALDGRSDVFSLGICMYEALTQKRLYLRSSEIATLEAITQEPPPSVREVREDVDPELDAIVQRCLAKSPDDRFPSAGDAQEAIEGYLAYEREAVGSKRIARLMRELFADAIAEGPKLDRRRDATGAFVTIEPSGGSASGERVRVPAAEVSTPSARLSGSGDGSPTPAPRVRPSSAGPSDEALVAAAALTRAERAIHPWAVVADHARVIARDRRAWVIGGAVLVALLAALLGGGDGEESIATEPKTSASTDDKSPPPPEEAAEPTLTEPTPAEPTPAEPTPAEPTPAEPTLTEPGEAPLEPVAGEAAAAHSTPRRERPAAESPPDEEPADPANVRPGVVRTPGF